MIRGVAITLAAVTMLAAVFVLYGRLTWRRATERLSSRIEAARLPPSPAVFDSAEVGDLPPPVRRYFSLVLEQGQPMVTGAVIRHVGTFNMSETGEQWRPFSSTQKVVTRPAGFVWDGRIAMAPAVPVRVHDAYVAGHGLLEAAVLGLVPVADMSGTSDLDRGELLRFFAEAVWYPTALLPSQGVAWEARDGSSARATLEDGGNVVELTFVFGEDGLIASARAEARGRLLGDTIVQTPWEGTWREYEKHDGMWLPSRGEVAWLTPDGRRPYWRGRVVDVRYELAR